MFGAHIVLSLCAGLFLVAARQGPPSDPESRLPGDRERKVSVLITTAEHTYRVDMDAAVDGVMTRDPIGYGAFREAWQPNRFVLLENIGDTDVVHPWILVNGRRGWRTLDEIARDAVRGCGTDAEKARAIWEFSRHRRFHATTWDRESSDAVKVYNVYGYTLCGNDAQIISDLWTAAGLRVRRGYPTGHCVAEVFYDGAYHLLDGDEHCIYLRRDNETIASEADAVRDHDLVKRTHTYGILRSDSRRTDEFSASLYVYEGERKGRHGGHTRHTMPFVLRPGESILWRWDHVGKQYTKGTELEGRKWRKDGEGDLRAWGPRAYANLRNGKLRYVPDLGRDRGRRGIADSAGLESEGSDLRPQKTGTPCHVTWRIVSPYVIVGGKLEGRFRRRGSDDTLRVRLSADGSKWDPVWTATKTGTFLREVVFGERLSLPGQPQYEYFVRVDMVAKDDPAAVGIESLAFETDVQMAPLALPELEAGTNTVRYVDETPGSRRVRITHAWVERPAWHPPASPNLGSPADGATVEGTRVAFAWQTADDPDGDAIADYRIQVAARPDFRWVLSPNFDKLLSKTQYRGKTTWMTPYVGLLNPATTYYWRVRARDARGVWGAWSEIRSFRCDAPGVPLEVKASADPERGTVVLTWNANPVGVEPFEYRVYASNERGFTTSDTEYGVLMGRGFCRTLSEYEAKGGVEELVSTAANFLTTTRERRLRVVGAGLTQPGANKAFYRVVAVDARGLRSGPSDYAEAPRPFVYTRPAASAVVGKRWSYEPRSLASIGDLRCRPGYKGAFWDREEVRFLLHRSPRWLTLDEATGRITGVPGKDDVGEHAVRIRALDRRGKSAEQSFEIRVERGS